MKKKAIALALALLAMAVIAGGVYVGVTRAQGPVPGGEISEEMANEVKELHSLRSQIMTLNLLNGLELSQSQMEFILEKAKEAQALREQHLTESEASLKEAISVLSELRDYLMRGENIPDELKARFRELEEQRKEQERQYREELSELARQVYENLEEHQRYALEEFVPCVVPPEGERIGQARKKGGFGGFGERLLLRLRRMPGHRFNAVKEDIAERMVEQMGKHLPPGVEFDQEAEKERILKLLEEAYNLSDEEFALRKSELLEEFAAPYRQHRAQERVEGKIIRFLFSPEAISLLEQQLGQ